MSEWISVKDELPMSYENVIVCYKNAVGYRIDITYYCRSEYGSGWYLPVNITHWMPLPPLPPKEG